MPPRRLVSAGLTALLLVAASGAAHPAPLEAPREPTTAKDAEPAAEPASAREAEPPTKKDAEPASAREPATAKDAEPAPLALQIDLRARYNPVGLILPVFLRYRDVYRRSPSPLWDGLYLQAAAGVTVSPSFVDGELHAEWMPIKVLILRVGGNLTGYFGSQGYLLGFPTRDAPFGDDEARARKGAETSGVAERVYGQVTLQAQLGPVVARDVLLAAAFFMPDDAPFHRDPVHDTLLARRDLLLQNTALVGLQAWKGKGEEKLLVGPFYEVTHAREADLFRQRTGGLGLLVPTTRWLGLDRPRAYVQAGVNLEDRNRDGRFFVQGGVGADVDLR